MNADDVNVMLAEHFPGAGANCVELGGTYAVASTELSELSIRPGGYVSGPTQFAIADAALWYVTFVAIGRIEPADDLAIGMSETTLDLTDSWEREPVGRVQVHRPVHASSNLDRSLTPCTR